MPVGISAYVPLANLTLSSSAASVTFSSISQAYRDLVLFADTKTTGFAKVLIRINGDTTSSYTWIFASGRSTAGVASGTQSGTFGAISPENYMDSTNPLSHVANFMDYSATDKHKTWITRSNSVGASYAGAEMSANRWANTSAINTILIYPDSGTFASGSTFALYGIAA